MTTMFFIPEGANKLTQNDLNNGYLRITSNNKKYFPNEDCDDLTIIFNKLEYKCSLRTRDSDGKDRSYTLVIGKDLINLIGIKTSSILELNQISPKKFEIMI